MMRSLALVLLLASPALAAIYGVFSVTPNPCDSVGGVPLRISGSFAELLGTEQWRCQFRDSGTGVTLGDTPGTYISNSRINCNSWAHVGSFEVYISDDNGANYYVSPAYGSAQTFCQLETVNGFVYNVTAPGDTEFGVGSCGNGFWIEGGGTPFRNCDSLGVWGPVQNGDCVPIPRPIIEFISPINVGTAGGFVTVIGQDFTNQAICVFGSNEDPAIFSSSTQITCQVPAASTLTAYDTTASLIVKNDDSKQSLQTRLVTYTQCSGSCPVGFSKQNAIPTSVDNFGGATYTNLQSTAEICSGVGHGKCQSDCTCLCNAGFDHSSLSNKNCDVEIAPSSASRLVVASTLIVSLLVTLALL